MVQAQGSRSRVPQEVKERRETRDEGREKGSREQQSVQCMNE